MDLFDQARETILEREAPLAARMRPRTLEEFIGQRHVLGPGRLLRRAIEADRLSSLIFHGPPGTGKTTLARIIANTTRAQFTALNAVLSGVADIREAVAQAKARLGELGHRTILFIDEVHRFNKAQQDALLPHVENGTVILIGATTENPYFEVNKPLISRSRIFQLKSLEEEDLEAILLAALADPERGYGRRKVKIAPDALSHLAGVANGDARAALNALELAVETTEADPDGSIAIGLTIAEESIQRKAVLYDKEGDAHFDAISAFIKSLRGSDADAALYWMARMVYAGEDPRFIFRRMIVFAAEDVGLADPNALQLVMSAAQAFDYVGLPEGRFHLAEACLYLATAPKSNTAFAFFDALSAVESERVEDVPDHLKDASRDAEGFGHGQGYLYPHSYRDHWVAQQYLPEGLRGRVFYEPTAMGFEGGLRERVQRNREAAWSALSERDAGILAGLPFSGTGEGTEDGTGDGTGESTGDGTAPKGSPAQGVGKEWKARGRDTLAEWLGALRDRIFELAEVGRHHLVLDAHAASGLLAWEAARRATEGGVWAAVRSKGEADVLGQQAALLPALNGPEVIQAALAELNGAIPARAGETVLFDRVLCRDGLDTTAAVGSMEGIVAQIQSLARLTAPGGRLVLAERAPGLGGRMLASLDWSGVPPRAAKRAIEAEAQLYAASQDASMHWKGNEAEAWCEAAGLKVLRGEVFRRPVTFEVPPGLIARWFDGESSQPGPLAAALGKDGVLGEDGVLVRAHLERTLSGRTIRRVTAVMIVVAEHR
ncbi:MAG: AAA family ATPase [SAR324 cluster bacterium]|nr:AAA family ATPase [SAR324 cluster bacterium]